MTFICQLTKTRPPISSSPGWPAPGRISHIKSGTCKGRRTLETIDAQDIDTHAFRTLRRTLVRHTLPDANGRTFACLIVVHLWITIQPLSLKYLIRGPAADFEHFGLDRQVALPLTIVTCGLKYRYAFCHRRTRIPFVVWRIDRW